MTDFMALPIWPGSSDNMEQQLFFSDLKLALKSATSALFQTGSYKVKLTQPTEPSQSQWEAAWTAQTGRSLPILPTAILLWIDSATNQTAGVYSTTSLDSGTILRRESRYPRSGVSYRNIVVATSAQSSNAAIGINNSNHPSLTWTQPVKADVLFTYQLYVLLSSGTGTWGADFVLDGVKLGSQIFGTATNSGIINNSASGDLMVACLAPNVTAGQHTVQVIFGVTGSPASPPTLAYGGVGSGAGQYGVRELVVEAITK